MPFAIERDAADLRNRNVRRRHQDLHDLEARRRAGGSATWPSVHPDVDGVKFFVPTQSRAEGAAPENVIREALVVRVGLVAIEARLQIRDETSHGVACFSASSFFDVERWPRPESVSGQVRRSAGSGCLAHDEVLSFS
jgi:hypothetical protein